MFEVFGVELMFENIVVDYVLCFDYCLVMKFEWCGLWFGYGVWDLVFCKCVS